MRPTRTELRDHLITSRIAGDVATPREGNLRNYLRLARRETAAMFGLDPGGTWSYPEILELMAKRCGVSPDAGHRRGGDTIDPDRTLEALEVAAARIAQAARERERVIVATGHPSGILPIHLAVAGALRAAGVTLLAPAAGWVYHAGVADGVTQREIRYIGGVAMVSDGAALHHTHSPRPMRAMLAELTAQGLRPDLVFADHGWAGAAGQAGIDTIGFADSNDPALFVGEAEGRLLAVVPLDDNVAPHLYDPLAAYLLARAGLAPYAG